MADIIKEKTKEALPMPLSILGALSSYMFVSSFTPGPGNILAMNTTSRFGWHKGKPLVLGICCGYFCVQMLCTLALYRLNMVFVAGLSVLKYIGGLYMVWLAFHMARSRPGGQGQNADPTFRTGFMLQLVNVKIYFYITSLLTAYFIPYIESLQGLVLAGLGVVAVGSSASLVWAFLGVRLQTVYEKYYRIINSVLALLLLSCAWNIIRS